MSCPFNPFNPEAPKAFDAIVGLGLAAAGRWLEQLLTPREWARHVDAMDRRFAPERDLPLISYEAQRLVLRKALDGVAFPEVRRALLDKEESGLKSDARLVFEKLAQSEAKLVQIVQPNPGLPYYTVKDLYGGGEYLYVDFGDQEPLEAGALMFGRFLVHENCLYVIPGVFVGTPDVLGQIQEEIEEYLGEGPTRIPAALQEAVPEVWNICAQIQDERDGLGTPPAPGEGDPVQEDPCRVSFFLDAEKHNAVAALDRHPFFNRYEGEVVLFEGESETIFDVYVLPETAPPIAALEGEEELEGAPPSQGEVVRVGSVYVAREKMTITALNPIEMELLKGLVLQIVALPNEA
ncbi:hypothetical protein JIN87_14685 [Pelagicoccus mobilis]|uniref:Uncharacterized protein n=2 Tax=Pelagicoccus mobilis TaxID=415221 RepID=A0A934VRZ3_9BACT|nr:hypothetical protein [Pelagicoccus mobilis]